MTLNEFQDLVRRNEGRFDGVHPETEETLSAFERALGCRLPPSLRWLLVEKGYSGSWIDALDDSVRTTLDWRVEYGLPAHCFVLNDWQDGGLVWMDTSQVDENGEYSVLWGGAQNVLRLSAGKELDADVRVFKDFPAWVSFWIEDSGTAPERDG